MNNTITTMDLTRVFPPALTNDPKMIALAKVVAEQLTKTNREIPKNIIYAKIDELEEGVLDVLAYDLHVDWYDYGYPIEAKRAVIKDSVKVHKRLGTVYAVRTALGSVYPESELEEWFQYGGTPQTFRVVLDVTNARAPAEYYSIKKALDSYKRLSAQMENLIYQCRVGIHIKTTADGIQYLTGYTGRRLAGTYPQRNTLAGLADAGVAVYAGGAAFRFTSTETGTKPQRNITAALRSSTLRASGAGEPFGFAAPATGKYNAGTMPGRNRKGAVESAEIRAYATAEAYQFTSPAAGTQPGRAVTVEFQSVELQASGAGEPFGFAAPATGKHNAGTTPGRNTGGAVASAEIGAYPAAEAYRFTSPAAGTQPQRGVTAEFQSVELQASGEGTQFHFTSPAAGTQPGRAVTVELQSVELQASGEGAQFHFTSPAAGTQPERSATAEGENGGIIPTVTAEGFKYRFKRCGTSRCKE